MVYACVCVRVRKRLNDFSFTVLYHFIKSVTSTCLAQDKGDYYYYYFCYIHVLAVSGCQLYAWSSPCSGEAARLLRWFMYNIPVISHQVTSLPQPPCMPQQSRLLLGSPHNKHIVYICNRLHTHTQQPSPQYCVSFHSCMCFLLDWRVCLSTHTHHSNLHS